MPCDRDNMTTDNIVDVEQSLVSSAHNDSHDIWIIYGNEHDQFSETPRPLCDF